jgi:hypothetical protein
MNNKIILYLSFKIDESFSPMQKDKAKTVDALNPQP